MQTQKENYLLEPVYLTFISISVAFFFLNCNEIIHTTKIWLKPKLYKSYKTCTYMDSELKKKLGQICKDHAINDTELKYYNGPFASYDRYPYAPYIPKNWNGILVLGTSQKIKVKNNGDKEYRESLLDLSDDYLIFRLGNQVVTGKKPDQFLGVEPWDNGFLKLAMLSCFPESKVNEFAVSNVIPWELSKENEIQNNFLASKSINFLKAVLPIIKPKYIISASQMAQDSMLLGYSCKKMNFRYINLLAPGALRYIINLFDENDLYFRYPEVRCAFELNPKLIKRNNPNWRHYVIYAAHAVSKIKSKTFLP